MSFVNEIGRSHLISLWSLLTAPLGTGLVVSLGLVFSASPAYTADPIPWSYSGDSGPENWAWLEDRYRTCGTGRQQSPVDLTRPREVKLPTLTFRYEPDQATAFSYDGNELRVEYAPGNELDIGSMTSELVSASFHLPSEHTIDGKHYPLEIQFRHKGVRGWPIMVSVLFETGRRNTDLSRLMRHLPTGSNDTQPVTSRTGDLQSLLNSHSGYYRYGGSLTTPPCKEGVDWLILEQRASLSLAQLKALQDLVNIANNRPVQPLNGRRLARHQL